MAIVENKTSRLIKYLEDQITQLNWEKERIEERLKDKIDQLIRAKEIFGEDEKDE